MSLLQHRADRLAREMLEEATGLTWYKAAPDARRVADHAALRLVEMDREREILVGKLEAATGRAPTRFMSAGELLRRGRK